MEIISFVQDEQPAFRLPVFTHKKIKQRKNSSQKYDFSVKSLKRRESRVRKFEKRQKKAERWSRSEFMPFDTELKSFAAAQVYQPLSIRDFFRGIGKGLTLTGEFVKENTFRILISAVCTVVTIFGIIVGIKLYEYKISHTGPLEIKTEAAVDYENLNKLMASFALDSGVEYDAEGYILESEGLKNSKIYKQPVTYQNYKVRYGDTIGGITLKFGLSNISTLISVNDIGNVRQLSAGQKLKIPSMDGIVYTVQNGDSINSIVKKYGISVSDLLDVNDLSSEVLTAGQVLFLPGAYLDSKSLKNAMGDKFGMPIKDQFRWTSMFGGRIDPISGKKSSHTGVDMACPTGTPIYASMTGKVSYTGVSNIFGNYVIINHENGYQTLYAHMSKIIAKKGQWVTQGTKIGLVGSTGYSTGPHLHFTVYKNGKLIDPKSVLK